MLIKWIYYLLTRSGKGDGGLCPLWDSTIESAPLGYMSEYLLGDFPSSLGEPVGSFLLSLLE